MVLIRCGSNRVCQLNFFAVKSRSFHHNATIKKRRRKAMKDLILRFVKLYSNNHIQCWRVSPINHLECSYDTPELKIRHYSQSQFKKKGQKAFGFEICQRVFMVKKCSFCKMGINIFSKKYELQNLQSYKMKRQLFDKLS